MNTIYKRIIFASLFFGFILINSSCKKNISEHPFEMEGVWYAPNAFSCGGPVLVIEKNGNGKLLGQSGNCDTRKPEVNGKVKYKKDILHIGDKSYTILHQPEIIAQGDSINAPYAYDLSSKTLKRYLIQAKMTIQERKVLTNEGKYILYKYVDY